MGAHVWLFLEHVEQTNDYYKYRDGRETLGAGVSNMANGSGGKKRRRNAPNTANRRPPKRVRKKSETPLPKRKKPETVERSSPCSLPDSLLRVILRLVDDNEWAVPKLMNVCRDFFRLNPCIELLVVAEEGHPSLLRASLASGSDYVPFVLLTAASKGRLDVLQRVVSEYCDAHARQCLDSRVGVAAVLGRHLHILKWLKRLTAEGDPVCATTSQPAAKPCYEELVKWLSTNRVPNIWMYACCKAAIQDGEVAPLQLLVDRHHHALAYACEWWGIAARSGRTNVLEWLHANFALDGSATQYVQRAMAENRHLNVLEWLHVKYEFNQSRTEYVRRENELRRNPSRGAKKR